MIRNVQRTWFEVWGEETAQNRILKALLLFFVLLSSLQTITIAYLSYRKPLLFGVSTEFARQISTIVPTTEVITAEVKRVVKNYVHSHHNWDWNEIDIKMKEAARYVDYSFEKGFTQANQDQVKIARERKISQRFYLQEPQVNLDAKVARIVGDRILLLSGLRATNPMTVEVGFSLGPRTSANPEGVYIVSEKLIPTANEK